MPGCADLAIILLAAGEGRRFGGRKLEADLDGRMLGLHAAETVAAMGFGAMLAVGNAQQPKLNAALRRLGFDLVISPDPAAGQASSLALGVQALGGGDWRGLLIALADMPYVTSDHLIALANAFANAAGVVCSSNGAHKMPPAIFPRTALSQLIELSGDQGARALLTDAVSISADERILRDVDVPGDI